MVALPRRMKPLFRSEESPDFPPAPRRDVQHQRLRRTVAAHAACLKEGRPQTLEQLWEPWLQRYLASCGSGVLTTPVDFLYWLFRHPELPSWQRTEVAHMLAIELIQQERDIRREQLEQFIRWNRASRRRLRCGGFSPRDRVVANPLVIRLSWEEPCGPQDVQTAQKVQWLFFPAESRLVALRPKPGVLELLAPLSRAGSQGITLQQWLEQLAPEQAARVLHLLPELFQLGLAAAVE